MLLRDRSRSLCLIYEVREGKDRKMGGPQDFCPGDAFPNLTFNVQYDEILYAFEGQLYQNKTPVGTLCWSSSQMLAHKGGRLQTQLPHYIGKRRKLEMCVKLHWFNLITPRSQKGSGFGCVIPAPQLAGYGQGKEAVGRKPAKQNISDPQLLRARKTHVDVAKFSE